MIVYTLGSVIFSSVASILLSSPWPIGGSSVASGSASDSVASGSEACGSEASGSASSVDELLLFVLLVLLFEADFII